jgi:Rha family phage regulatory protein
MSEDIKKHTTYSADGATRNLPSIPVTAVTLSIGPSGDPTVDSRDVAARFGKQHKDVLRKIDAIVSDAPSTQRNFAPSSYQAENGKSERCYLMDEDGFSILAHKFTGKLALEWTIKYVRAFAAMRQRLLEVPTAPVAQLTEREAIRAALAGWDTADARAIALEAKVAVMAPSVAALDRISESDGSLCPTDAAKVLKIKPRKFTAWLRENGWVYSRGGSNKMIGRSEKVDQDLLEHKCYVTQNSDGDEVTRSQVMVTSKGMAKLATVFTTEEPAQKSLEV